MGLALRSRTLLVASVAALAVVATACTDKEAGTPTQAGGDTPSVEPGGTGTEEPSTTPSIPPRPAELKLDAVNPCSLLTTDQLKQLKVNRTRERANGTTTYKGAKECVLNVTEQEPYYDYVISAVTTEGIAPWLSGKRNVDVELVSVGGYAAARYDIRGEGPTSSDCTTSIDVADGQQLMVSMSPISLKVFSQEQICQMSEQAAGLVLTTLQASR